MRFFVTKYALTAGIQEVEASDPAGTEYAGMISVPSTNNLVGRPEYFHGKDWHRTREDAVKQAEKMRVAKIASCRKQINKLEKMKFE